MTVSYDDLGPDLVVEARGAVRVLTLNGPDRLNSFDDALHRAFVLVWDRLYEDEEAAAVVITGEGRAFSAGGDFSTLERSHRDPQARRRIVRDAERLVRAMAACELPIVAAINGPAVGLGASVALLCDIVIMSTDAYLCDPHVSVGVVAGDGGAVVWPLLTSLLKAKEHLLLGDRIGAAECERIGLANHVTSGGEVMHRALELAQRLAAQPRTAVRDTKRALNQHLQQAVNLVLGFALAAESESFSNPAVASLVARLSQAEPSTVNAAGRGGAER